MDPADDVQTNDDSGETTAPQSPTPGVFQNEVEQSPVDSASAVSIQQSADSADVFRNEGGTHSVEPAEETRAADLPQVMARGIDPEIAIESESMETIEDSNDVGRFHDEHKQQAEGQAQAFPP